MNRRDFLLGLSTGMASMSSGYLFYNMLKGDETSKIYELGKYLQIADITSSEHIPGSITSKTTQALGIILEDEYFTTVAHTIKYYKEKGEEYSIRMPNGERVNGYAKKNIDSVKLNDLELEEIILNPENETAIYKLPKKIPELTFPCKPQTNYNLGDKIYIIGNPDLGGINIREGRISSLEIPEFIKEMVGEQTFFGIDIPIIPGDSGAPIVNENFELLGFASIGIWNALSYIKPIKFFLKD